MSDAAGSVSDPAGSAPNPEPEFLAFDRAGVRFGPDGLVPGIVQDALDGRVLMLGYLDGEALAATLTTGDVHFHSRSRSRLWRKGETSGNVLRLRAIALDCDADALLLTVDPVGPTCHRGTRSCFDHEGAPIWTQDTTGSTHDTAGSTQNSTSSARPQGFAWLETLWSTIEERATSLPEGSYTARLLAGGVDAVGRKVTEEATEILLAAKDDAAAEDSGADRNPTRTRLAEETADMLYHTLVLLTERGVDAASALDVLRSRHTRPNGDPSPS